MQITCKKIKGVYCIATTLVLFVFLYFNNTNYIRRNTFPTVNSAITFVQTTAKSEFYKKPDLSTKYILLWTNPNKYPFKYFGEGNTVFKKRKCKFTNCYVTSDRQMLGHYSEFEVIAFNGPQLTDIVATEDVPNLRGTHQKYVYTNIEAAVNYPICDNIWNQFFNWTWTYKLSSDAVWGYIAIRNSSNHVIGPSFDIEWLSEDYMAPIGDNIKSKIANKSIAAAWFVSNCRTLSGREQYVNSLQHYINAYNLKIDVYGACGDFQCPKDIMNRCLDELQRKYYFYLAFENALSEDYVSEKILHALNHYTVPIVYGGANYTRFMPPRSYINALEIGPQLLARKMYEIIENPELYHKYFKWRKYYSFHLRDASPETDDYCKFCALVNDEEILNKSSVYNNFSAWWTPQSICWTSRELNKRN